MKSYKIGSVIGHSIRFADGTKTYTSKGETRALELVAEKFGIDAKEMIWSDDAHEDRMLVWASAGDAEQDDGQRAIAEIRTMRRIA